MTAESLSASEAKRLLDSGEPVVFVDARNPVAWENSHQKLPGALRVPVDEVSQHLGELPRGAVAITYCT